MSTLKQNIENLLDGTIIETEMKSFIGEYLAERFSANIVLSNTTISNLLNDIGNPLGIISPRDFLYLLLRHQNDLEFIDTSKITFIRENEAMLSNSLIFSIITEDDFKILLEKESINRSNYSDTLDENYISSLIIKQLANIDDSNKVTEAEAIKIIDNYFFVNKLDPSEMVDKTGASDIALQTFNDNIGNTLTGADLQEKIKYEIIALKEVGELTEEKVGELILDHLKDIPTDSLRMDETIALVENSIDRSIHNTINSSSLINYVLRQMEVKKWICEITNPFTIQSCDTTVNEEYMIILKAPDSIYEGEIIPYVILLTKGYSSDIIVHLSNGLTVGIPAGERIGMIECDSDVYDHAEDVYKNEEVYIVNIDKIEGLSGYEDYSTDSSGVAKTRIKDNNNTTKLILEFPSNVESGSEVEFKIFVSNAPKTDMNIMVKFGDIYKSVKILAGNFETSGFVTIKEKGIFFAGITDVMGGNFENVKFDNTYEFISLAPGKHIMYSISAPYTAKEGDIVRVDFKVNKPTLLGNTVIYADVNGSTREFIIPPGETEIGYSFEIENNIWKG